MSSYNFDGHGESDWEDRGDLSWNEFDWQQFLQRQQAEVARFVNLYNQHAPEAERLDLVAREMGWDVQDWSLGDSSSEAEEEADETSDFDPYTLHRHPVFVVVTGLVSQLRFAWEIVLKRRPREMNALICWRYADQLGTLERQCLLALQSLDMGDFMLAVVHMKFALRAVNECLRILPSLARAAGDWLDFQEQTRKRLFDIREVCLRVMSECREEDRRGPRGAED